MEFAAPLESVGRSVLMVRSPELFGAVRSRQDLLSLAAGASSLCRGGAPRSVGGRGAESLPASVAVLLSTSAAKLSLDCGGSGRAAPLQGQPGEDVDGGHRRVGGGAGHAGQGDAEPAEGDDQLEVVDGVAVLAEEEGGQGPRVVALERHHDPERRPFHVIGHRWQRTAGAAGRYTWAGIVSPR